MANKELIEKVARAMCEKDGAKWNAKDCLQTASGEEPEQQREYWRDKAQTAADTIFAAIAEPNEAMWEAFYIARDVTFPEQMREAKSQGKGWKGLPAVVWRAMLAASPLGE